MIECCSIRRYFLFTGIYLRRFDHYSSKDKCYTPHISSFKDKCYTLHISSSDHALFSLLSLSPNFSGEEFQRDISFLFIFSFLCCYFVNLYFWMLNSLFLFLFFFPPFLLLNLSRWRVWYWVSCIFIDANLVRPNDSYSLLRSSSRG